MRPTRVALFFLALGVLSPLAGAHDRKEAFAEHHVVGGPDDFLEVRHVVLRGSQFEIGRRLAELARERHGYTPSRSADPMRTHAQREYFRRNAPLFLERMRGVADATGIPLEDDAWNLASIPLGFTKPGCTVAYYPPSLTEWGTGVVSRNFDFTTGTMMGRKPGPDQIPIVSTPYLVETHPDEGYSSLSICAYDLLGGVVDGINSEGLTIALLADDEVMGRYDLEPARGPQAGFGVIQIGRHVLETCATVEEAQIALLEAKLYYTSIPCHYLIADRHGRAFVWENSRSLTQGHVFEAEDEPLVTTNFMLNLHPERDALPADGPGGSFSRYATILDRWKARGEKVDLEFVIRSHCTVAATGPAPPAPYAAGRTLWHALYFPEERRLEVDFYLGEGEDGEIRRSDYIPFELEEEPRVVEAR